MALSTSRPGLGLEHLEEHLEAVLGLEHLEEHLEAVLGLEHLEARPWP